MAVIGNWSDFDFCVHAKVEVIGFLPLIGGGFIEICVLAGLIAPAKIVRSASRAAKTTEKLPKIKLSTAHEGSPVLRLVCALTKIHLH